MCGEQKLLYHTNSHLYHDITLCTSTRYLHIYKWILVFLFLIHYLRSVQPSQCMNVCVLCFKWCVFLPALEILAGERREGRWRDRIGPVSGRAPHSLSQSAECLRDCGPLGKSWHHSPSSHLARQPHVNITSISTHTRSEICLRLHTESLSKALRCSGAVLDRTITFSYSSFRRTSMSVEQKGKI